MQPDTCHLSELSLVLCHSSIPHLLSCTLSANPPIPTHTHTSHRISGFNLIFCIGLKSDQCASNHLRIDQQCPDSSPIRIEPVLQVEGVVHLNYKSSSQIRSQINLKSVISVKNVPSCSRLVPKLVNPFLRAQLYLNVDICKFSKVYHISAGRCC